ncbi:hypothetical protein RCG17_12000 [Neobacillus sp. PS3-12]|uniref:hypothetical protein n=1 Tax=Neobacillus sp. PS3-12 TaxID=3070677 RepID=UPI0027E04A67|nr:hypothetical protein [Neobacillus sp. PS3-12]WML55241.1 hypothetical protein RCG17_12000 [Neobacillus sp. PS3-12]
MELRKYWGVRIKDEKVRIKGGYVRKRKRSLRIYRVVRIKDEKVRIKGGYVRKRRRVCGYTGLYG